MKRKGLNALLLQIPSNDGRSEDNIETAAQLADIVQTAARWIPVRAACLEISLATALMAKRQGIAVQLVIGVKHSPFLAHAWVLCSGQVLTDTQEAVEDFQPIFQT